MSVDATTAPIQGTDVLFEASADNGTTWKTLVCLTKQGWQKQRAVSMTHTQCGSVPGIGSLEHTVPVEGAVNVVLEDEEADYVSAADLDAWIESGVAVMVRQKTPGVTPYLSNQKKAYLTDLNVDSPVGNVVTFTGTFKPF